MIKKYLLILFTAALFASCGKKESTDVTLDIVPYPNEVAFLDGSFDANGASVSYSADLDERSKALVARFAEQFFCVSGSNGSLTEGTAGNGFIFQLDKNLVKCLLRLLCLN